ncbi:uncharacterized protein LOC108451631 [Gossypium arboreum]|uniref:uncharacterized protein LOC108451631 n=1 Tax=Gossypium arboreum TaxID=29729 RepID=UPI0022F14F46|nr:uncharacterized protein LOC108451631 [Gossypium arboreum]
MAPRVIIQKPVSFPYKDSKRVPWNYDCNVTIPGGENSASTSRENQNVGFYTRSERRYDPAGTETKTIKGKTSLVEQRKEKTLHKQPARISVLALLLSSETHRSALMKVLNETYVADDISVNKLDRLVNNINADNFIFFNNDEKPPSGMRSTKALHITTRCKEYTLPEVLIDNGSVLNVLPLSTLNRLPVDSSHMKTCQNIVRAFDGAVPSSLHQKLKFITEGRLVTVNAEEDIIAPVTSDAPYVGIDDEAIECSFRSLEFVNATFIVEGNKVPVPKISKTTRIDLQLTVGKGALPGKGLGRSLQGRIEAPMLKDKRDRFGLGYKPDARQNKKEIEKRQERRRARLNREEVKWEPMIFLHISRTFVSGRTTYYERKSTGKEAALSINALSEEETSEEDQLGICPYMPGSVLNNWTAEEIPVTIGSIRHLPICAGLVKNGEGKEVKIGVRITAETRRDLIELLQEFEDFFAWSYQDMPRLNTDIVVHRLPIKEECKPVQQKLRRMRPDVLLKIKEEVKKQFDSGFLPVVKYSELVANIVPVSKKDGKVWMCVDYQDLKKSSPKDNFSLPHIDTLVDNMTGYSFFSFMNGFSGYNQINMYPEDMEKTTFVTMWGTEIEVYVADMVAKSRTEKEHVQVLRKLFLRLRKFQLKLNPSKCTFGARSGKLLGFVVNEKGIEIDLDKVEAIQELHPPRTQKEVRGFLRRLNYITRFISQLTEKCDPIFCLLRKHNQVSGTRSAKELSIKSNIYLSNALVLMPPCPDKPLILYLVVFENSMRYSPIEKLCCALIWTTRRLRQYMLYYTTWLISKLDPLKYMMESNALTGRMARWQILLSEFDIVYVNQKAIKESAIIDFLASRALEDYKPLSFDFLNEDLMYVATTEEDSQEDHHWKLNFDGASNALKGEWETRDTKLINYQKLVLELIEEFDDITFYYLPRDENQMANALAILASMIKVNKQEDMKPIKMSIYEAPAHCYNIDEKEEKENHPWYQDILQYVRNREYPDQTTENDKKTLRRLASDYVLMERSYIKEERISISPYGAWMLSGQSRRKRLTGIGSSSWLSITSPSG